MEYAEVNFYSGMIVDGESENFNNNLIASAYVAWLTTNTKKKKFQDYLKLLGLTERPEPLTKEEKKILQERADKLVEKILQADKKRKA